MASYIGHLTPAQHFKKAEELQAQIDNDTMFVGYRSPSPQTKTIEARQASASVHATLALVGTIALSLPKTKQDELVEAVR